MAGLHEAGFIRQVLDQGGSRPIITITAYFVSDGPSELGEGFYHDPSGWGVSGRIDRYFFGQGL